jgi:transposase
MVNESWTSQTCCNCGSLIDRDINGADNIILKARSIDFLRYLER